MISPLLLGTFLGILPANAPATEVIDEVIKVQQEPMAMSIARARLKEAMDHSTPFIDRRDMLADIVARSESIAYRAAAAYNLGVTLIKNEPDNANTLNDAIQWLRRADIEGINPGLRARARDTLGHARYLLIDIAESGEPELGMATDLNAIKESLIDRLEKLLVAAGAFRSAHDADPKYRVATENLERVRREIQEVRNQIDALEELIEQEKQQQQQRQQQQQESAERLDELADQQQQEAEENAANPQQQQEEQKKQQQDQEEICNETESEQENLNQSKSDQSEEMQQVEEQLNKAREAQERAQQALEDGNAEEAAEAQEEAAEALRNAAEQLREMSQGQEGDQEGEPQDGQQGEDGEQGDQQGKQQEGEQPEQEGDEISEVAKQLLEKERREREARDVYRSTGRPVPVERDW